MATWPATLPTPQVAQMDIAPATAFIRTDMEAGPARQRRRFTAVPETISATWIFNSEQMLTFRNFFEDDIAAGTGWFFMNTNLGFGEVQKEVRFTAAFNVKPSEAGVLWTVTAKLEVRA